MRRILAESSANDLESNIIRGFPNTTARQNATNPIRISQANFTPYTDGRLLMNCVATNSQEFVRKYRVHIMFSDVAFVENAPEGEEGAVVPKTGVQIRCTDGSTKSIEPISLQDNTCKVRCTCLDFYHRFSMFNLGDDSLHGKPMPQYVPKGSGRPPVNPARVPGMCKHIIKALQYLETRGIVR